MVELEGPPNDKFATNFFTSGDPPLRLSRLFIIYEIPAIIENVVPEPSPFKTFIPFNLICLATPKFAPPIILET
jgi:hypothetical protein